jgi:hypothetical protein
MGVKFGHVSAAFAQLKLTVGEHKGGRCLVVRSKYSADAIQNLGHDVSDQSVGNILKAHGIEPAPDRKRQTTWKTFLKAHWDVLRPSTSRPSRCGRRVVW